MASWLFIALATCYCDLAIYCQSRRGYCELAIYCLSSTSYCEMAILLPELDELLRDGHFIARARLVIARWLFYCQSSTGYCEMAIYCQIGEVVVSWLISRARRGYCVRNRRLGRAASTVIAGNDVRNRHVERYGQGEEGGTYRSQRTRLGETARCCRSRRFQRSRSIREDPGRRAFRRESSRSRWQL